MQKDNRKVGVGCMAPDSLVKVYRLFRGVYCPHHQDVTTQKQPSLHSLPKEPEISEK
jgi:hypothetical protein